jgi:hypothetical protein
MSRRVMQVVMATIIAMSISGCTPVRITSRPGGAHKARAELATLVRDCESAVYGELDRGWRRESLVVGPLSFVYGKGYGRRSPDEFRGRNGKYFPTKVLVVVENGAEVTITIPRPARPHASLLYDEESFGTGGRFRVERGHDRVSFEACRKGESPFAIRETQFNGAFIVGGPRCVPLHIRTDDEARTRRVVFSFGAGHCEQRRK